MYGPVPERLTVKIKKRPEYKEAIKIMPKKYGQWYFEQQVVPALINTLGKKFTPKLLVPFARRAKNAMTFLSNDRRYHFLHDFLPYLKTAMGKKFTIERFLHSADLLIDLIQTENPKKIANKGRAKTIEFEIELWCGRITNLRPEIRTRPFIDLADAMATLRLAQRISKIDAKDSLNTLHLNFGVTATQESNLMTNKKAIDRASRNLAIFCISPTRFANKNWKKDKIEIHHDIIPVGEQIARAEFRWFDISRGTDLALTRLTILAIWKMLDNPSIADEINKGFEQIFLGMGINPWKGRIPKSFHGWVSKKSGGAGGAYGCIVDQRPLVREMLATILRDGNLAYKVFDKHNPEEIFTLPNVRRAESSINLSKRAERHPFARVAARCPEPN